MQPFNKKFVRKSPFTMPGVYEVPDTLRQGSWAIKIDFKHGRISIFTEVPKLTSCFLAYYHVPMHASHSRYLCFVWNGKIYQFRVLCFGVKNAPFTFNRLGQVLRMFFNLRGVCIIIYIDDILVLSDSFEGCIKDAQFVIDTLIELGFHIKTEKCVLSPSQHFFFLGYLWDSNKLTCELPEEKLTNIKFLCQEVLDNDKVTVRIMQRLMGSIVSTRPAVPMSRARSRGIQRMVLDHYKGTPSSAKKLVRLTKWAREEVLWWLDLDIGDCHMSLKSIPVWESTRMATDAMQTAIGSVLEGVEMYEELDPITAKRRISHKEWLAFERTIQPVLHTVQDGVITWHVDNLNVRQAWLNSGSVRDLWLCKKVVEMQMILHKQNTMVIPVYVRSAQHLHADLISRSKIMPDWHLNRSITQKLFMQLGTPQVDLMATSNSNQVNQFFSALVDDGAMDIDAFTRDWDQFNLAYVFPPPPMVELILNRIFQCSSSSRFIMITPWKPKAQWFSKAVKLAVQDPVRLPVSRQTVIDLAESGCIPSNTAGGMIRFVAWVLIGGDGQKLENCPMGLSRLYSRAGRRALRSAMDWASGTGPSTAEGISWMKLPRVL